MKKIVLFSLSLFAVAFVSCNKENGPAESDKIPATNDGITIMAYVSDGDITKTSYENETTFSWTGSECLSMQLIKKTDGTTRDRWLFYNETEEGGSIAKFVSSGSLSNETWGLGEYAFYPFPGNSYCPDRLKTWNVGSVSAVNSGSAEVKASGLIVSSLFKSSVSNPLQFVPMIGYKDADDNFAFHTATGILKVTVTDIDDRLAKVQLYSNGQKLNGTYTMTSSGSDAYIAMTTSSTASEYVLESQYIDRSSETELPFYFPVPVGELASAFEIRLLDAGNNVLRTVKAPSAVTIERNTISEITKAIALPAEDFSATVTPGGTSSAIEATVDIAKDATSVKVVLAASEAAGLTLIDNNDASVVTFADGETKSIPMTNVTASGAMYLVAQSYRGTEAKLSSATSVFVITDADASAVASQYMRVLTNVGDWTSNYDFEITGDNTMTLEVSNDPTSGNIMLTEFCGYYYDPSLNTHTYLLSDWTGFTSGSPLYAVYNASETTFTTSISTPFYVDGGGHNHYISEIGRALRIHFNSNGYSSTNHDLVVWGAKVGNFWDSVSADSYADALLGRYVANKTKGKVDLTGKISVSSTGANNNYSGDNLGADALIDKDDSHWHSDYVDTPSLDTTYGIYIQIDLGEGKSVENFTFNIKTRNSSNQLPTKYIIGGSNDNSSWTEIIGETTLNSAAGKWYQISVAAGSSYRYLRLGFTESAAGDLTQDATTGKFVALSELQLWEN